MESFNNFLKKDKYNNSCWEINVLPQNHNLFQDKYIKGIRIVRLIDSFGSVDHVVAIYENKIFDSNMPMASELSEENLNKCCVGDDAAFFLAVFSEHVYIPRKRKVNR